MVPMRDGIRLRTRIWMPPGRGPFPVVLERGYWPGREKHAELFPGAGHVYVGQKARGDLDGGMFFPDAQDGYDCIEWVARQPWCDGNVAMYGRSFMGATQWLAAVEQPPHLRAIVPQNINGDPWQRQYRDHGALQLAHTARRVYLNESGDFRYLVEELGRDRFYQHLPLITLDEATVGRPNRLWKEYVSHATYDDYWQAISIRDKYDRIGVPAYIMGGWYDNYPGAAFDSYLALKEREDSSDVRVVIGPCNHNNGVVGDRDFGPDAGYDEIALALRWFDATIKGMDTGISDEPPIRIFVMGINQWRFENEWPLARTLFTPYYLHGDGAKDGWLSPERPGDEPPNAYVYDPDDPVPTLGGNHSSPEDRPDLIRVGAVDQRPNEGRQDVLTYTTPPLETDTEVTGPIQATLYAATSARDTDWIVRLIDVYPDGTAYNLCEGILRARFRESIYATPVLLEPGTIYSYTIDLLPTSNVFLKSHRIRVHVTSSNFPLYDRNPNTGHEQGADAELAIARQTIYHDATHPSHVVLPIVPR